MIQFLEKRADRFLDVKEIDNEASVGVDRSVQDEFDAIGMPVHPVTAMRLGNCGQTVGRLELESL